MVEVQTERVLVVPTELLHRLGYFQGFTRDVDQYLDDLFSPEHASYLPRSEVEHDPSLKQLIPYCIFRHDGISGHGGISARGDARHGPSVFQYTRGRGQGEGRLHALRSVGVGGHISIADTGADGDLHPYEEGLRRELEEEVFIDSPYRQQCVGLINDDETEVGRVHLGVVHLFDLAEPAVRPREADILDAGFRPIEELLANLPAFETWSQICLRALFGG